MAKHRHKEHHAIGRVGWLRAAVLGANDGIVSTASLIVGVAAAGTAKETILLSGVAGLVAGAMSMAAGEYVSVHSQADAENADLSKEKKELEQEPAAELRELTGIYVRRGLEPDLALQVAEQLTAHDALGAHARDELGISAALAAEPSARRDEPVGARRLQHFVGARVEHVDRPPLLEPAVRLDEPVGEAAAVVLRGELGEHRLQAGLDAELLVELEHRNPERV